MDNDAIMAYAFGIFNDDAATDWLRTLDEKVAELLDQHWTSIEALAHAVHDKRTWS
jgi:hypothetical protein